MLPLGDPYSTMTWAHDGLQGQIGRVHPYGPVPRLPYSHIVSHVFSDLGLHVLKYNKIFFLLLLSHTKPAIARTEDDV
jgi:hypothetical protein